MIVQRPKVRCRGCNTENNPDERACQNCGLPVTVTESEVVRSNIICPRCQHDNNLGSFFCYSCGKYFVDIEDAGANWKSKKGRRSGKERSYQKAKIAMPGSSEIMLTGVPVFIERSDFDNTLPHDILMSISRQHILITYSRGKYYLKDYGREGKGSTNHTKLNDVDIFNKKKKALKDGDVIELAGQSELTLTFRFLSESD
jgi:hypothetical protein